MTMYIYLVLDEPQVLNPQDLVAMVPKRVQKVNFYFAFLFFF